MEDLFETLGEIFNPDKKKLGRPRTDTKVLYRRIPSEHFCLIAEMVDCRLNEIKTVQHNSSKPKE